ncbi:dTDP-4-dehydrorhamnose reductase [Octadecabacter ascidiaceicola]|uniref:dTDP-4-dehydrorhamnose reductase n=1 Tax=Octadecabacter ascidiaceicola TaxID=1655543 RepID=A0A238JPZ5_9RHOB|nr:dTDP-4-dehydrorhamnose reductase [Octadecabacter ascidiaceicola]SMX32740.1 dTDP-4-dehydrorhamnose reductase [Octadecabacter ascidiaceicola]
MTILAFGRTGQVATELSYLPNVMCFGRDDADLTDPVACAKLVETHRPRAVINAAAYTNVDRAEVEEDIAHLVNAEAPKAIAQACADIDIPFVHISTDYVFDGSGHDPWPPDARPFPLNTYGRTKLSGENAISEVGGRYVILRTSWVFSPNGENFVKSMLRLGATRDELRIVADQVGGPTPARDIALACHTIAKELMVSPGKAGVYHLSGTPDCSRADFAREIFTIAQMPCDVEAILTCEFPTPADRPKNSRLDCGSLEQRFGISRPNWHSYLQAQLTEC